MASGESASKEEGDLVVSEMQEADWPALFDAYRLFLERDVKRLMQMHPSGREAEMRALWPRLDEHTRADMRALIDEAKRLRGELPSGVKAAETEGYRGKQRKR